MTLLHGLAGLSRADTSGPGAHCSSRKLMYSFTHRASGFAQTCRPFLVMNLWRQAGRFPRFSCQHLLGTHRPVL